MVFALFGAVFTAWGRTYRKSAMSMAVDDRGWGCVFMGETEVVSDGPVLPEEVAARWRPERGQWGPVVEGVTATDLTASHKILQDSCFSHKNLACLLRP